MVSHCLPTVIMTRSPSHVHTYPLYKIWAQAWLTHCQWAFAQCFLHCYPESCSSCWNCFGWTWRPCKNHIPMLYHLSTRLLGYVSDTITMLKVEMKWCVNVFKKNIEHHRVSHTWHCEITYSQATWEKCNSVSSLPTQAKVPPLRHPQWTWWGFAHQCRTFGDRCGGGSRDVWQWSLEAQYNIYRMCGLLLFACCCCQRNTHQVPSRIIAPTHHQKKGGLVRWAIQQRLLCAHNKKKS